ncbi:hypothetical protein CBR_g19191 [Chara braunii]|uniref:DUF659 domain-containing protein n=1 Tax=Chara braunii TaxID=69332 RepID=A0A388JTH4_CHABU|nr:hypothetical protein CBR_g19191 [Chara braunii]|eukprot:GBG61114.1 hypothetical protein CBR_g19191 [Chara braunii]
MHHLLEGQTPDGGDTSEGTISLDDDLDANRQRGGRSRGDTQPAGFQHAPTRVPGSVGGVSGGIEAGDCSVSAAPASTSVVGRRRSTLNPYIGNKIQMDLDRLWPLAIYCGGVAFNWLHLAETQQLWDYICTLFRPTIVPVPRLHLYEGVRTRMMDIIFHEVAALIAPKKAKWATSGCTLMMDGLTDTTNKPIMNFIAAGDSGTILIRTIDMSYRGKTGVSLTEIWEDVIRHDIGIENINAICMDNAELMKTLRDIVAQPFARQTMKDEHKIVKFMRNKQKALALHKVMKKALVLRRPAEMRFGTPYMMLERLYDQREVLDTLVSSERWARVRWAGDARERMPHVRRLCRDDDFWSGVMVMDLMGPVYAFLRDLDRDGSSPTGLWPYGISRSSSGRDFFSVSKRTDDRYVDIWEDQLEEEEVALDEDDAIPADVLEEEAEAIERSNRRKEGRNRAGKGKAPAMDSEDEEDDIFDDLV